MNKLNNWLYSIGFSILNNRLYSIGGFSILIVVLSLFSLLGRSIVEAERTKIATGAVAVSYEFEPDSSQYVTELRVHLSAAGGAGNLTVTLDSEHGAAYDVLFLTQDMTAITDLVWQPTKPIWISKGASLNVAWANANTRTYGLEILTR